MLALAPIAGLLLWTLLEYLIHGALAHRLRTPVGAIHDTHHRDPRLVFTGPVWFPVALLLGAGLVAGLGPVVGGLVTAGAVAGFFRYEYIHWRIHYTAPRGPRERALWNHHLAHHYRQPGRAHGVSTRLWDRICRTMPDPRALDAVDGRPPLETRHGFWESLLAVDFGLSR